MGSPQQILREASLRICLLLASAKLSGIYRTKPRYLVDQADFYNMAICGFTSLSPLELLEKTQAIESDFGRNRALEQRNGPRPLDIDIVLFGDSIIREPNLTVPHPGIAERAFVLVPLLELDAELVHPGTKIKLSQYLLNLPEQGIYAL